SLIPSPPPPTLFPYTTLFRSVAARKPPDFFSPMPHTGPSWSPDGQLIACAVHTIGAGYRVLAVGVEDGKEQILTPQPWEFIARRSEEHTSELQSRGHLVCRLL